jgi:hypothetical protein
MTLTTLQPLDSPSVTRYTSRMANTAKVVPGVVVVKSFNGEHGILTVDVPDGYADVKRFSKFVLEFAGNTFTFTGWNSDTNEAYFKSGAAGVATIRGNR